MPIHLAVRCLLAVAIAASLPVAPATAADATWVEVKSPHFTVVSDAGERRARDVAWQFEQVRSAMQALWSWARTTLDRPIVVVAAKDESTMRALLPQYWERGSSSDKPVSVFVGASEAYYIGLRADALSGGGEPTINPYSASYWSYAALILRQALGPNMPLWFRDGLAGVVSNAIVRPEEVRFGMPLPGYLQNLRQGGRLRLSELLAVDEKSPFFTGITRDVFDSQSWGLVNYLLYGRPDEQAGAIDTLAQLLESGVDSVTAVQKVFGSLDSLEGAYLRYANQPIYRYGIYKVQTDIAAKDFAARPVTPAEASAARAMVHLAMRRSPDAQAAIAASRKAEPQSAAAHAAEALLFDRDNNTAEARAAYAQAADGNTTNFYVYYRLAVLSWRQDGDAAMRANLEKWLRQSIALNDAYWPAYLFLADTMARDNPSEAVNLASKALGLRPRDAAPRMTLARALVRASRPDVARAHARAAVDLASGDEEKKAAQALLEAIERAPAPR